MEIICKSTDQLRDVANALLHAYPDNRIFAMYGDMGAGKTTFIKALCEVLQVEDVISSPTFAIVNVYSTIDNDQVNHFDFYRVKKHEEVFDIGYEDYFFSGDYCFLEWPEIIETLLPADTVNVTITVNETDNSRLISF